MTDRQHTPAPYEPDYIERTIATIRLHGDSENSWPQWANILADQVEALSRQVSTLTEALNCEHAHSEDVEQLWEFVNHEGRTWNRCKSCGLLELWEGGLFVRAVALAPASADQPECSYPCCRPQSETVADQPEEQA